MMSSKDAHSDGKYQDGNNDDVKLAGGFLVEEGVLLIFIDPECKRVLKCVNWKVNAVMLAVPK